MGHFVLITPGIDFLVRLLALPIVGAIVIQHVAKTYFDFPIPTGIAVFSALSFPPIWIALRLIYREISDHREAARLGARLAPRVKGRLPGNIDVLVIMRRKFKRAYPSDGLLEFTNKLGYCFNARMLWGDLIFASSPEHIKQILVTDFNNFVKGSRFSRAMDSVLGTGVFNSDGDMWKFHRSITRPVFTRDRISDFDLFDRHSETVIAQLKGRFRQGHPVDFQDLMCRFTLDSATEFLFGSCVHSLSSPLPFPHNSPEFGNNTKNHTSRADDFALAFAHAQDAIFNRERLGVIWPLWETSRDKTKKPMKVVNAYIEPIIKEALSKKQAKGVDDIPGGKQTLGAIDKEFGDDETLLDHLVSLTDDPIVIRDETLNIMLAGRDTTAATLTFIIYLLSLHPNVTTRLRSEILEKVGPSRRPTYDDIRDLKYLRAVINETLRLYPAVPFNVRETVNATVWPSPDPTQKPIYIPAGSKTAYSVFMMHRRKDLWGPDAEEFDPDRFLDDRLKKYLLSNSFIFLPFNAGPRICLGQQFAYNEMSFMLIRLLQSFSHISLDLDAFHPDSRPPPEWSQDPGRKGVEKIYPKHHIILYSKGGLWVRMTEAEVEQ